MNATVPTVTWADGFGRWHAKAQSKALARSAVAAEIWARMPRGATSPTPDLVRIEPGHWAEADPLPPACEFVRTCEATSEYIDNRGYVYCERHARPRGRLRGPRRGRKMTPREIDLLRAGQQIAQY